MILENAKPRLTEAYVSQNLKDREVTFLYNELLTHDKITSVFEWLFMEGIPFETRYDEYRFVIIIK